MKRQSNSPARPGATPPANDTSSTPAATSEDSRPQRAQRLTWQDAAGTLRRSAERLRRLRDKGAGRLQRLMSLSSTYLPPHPLGALCGVADAFPLTPENVLLGYAQGLFPMDVRGTVRWRCPPERFVMYLSELRISPNMRRDIKQSRYDVTFDQAPLDVLHACAADRGADKGTWLSERFIRMYMELWEMGAMHSVEAWKEGQLVGGSFGVSIGRIWTVESMFHRATNAGKVQFAAVAAHLSQRGFEAIDAQIYSEHLARFGARDIPMAEYRTLLARGLANPASFHPGGVRPKPGELAPPAALADPPRRRAALAGKK